MEYSIEQLRNRHSVRKYLTDAVPHDIRRLLNADVTMINSHEAGFNFQLAYDDPDPLKGFRRSYGFFKNARNYLAPVMDPSFEHAEERAGYYAEQFVMSAVTHGLGTCFIGGTYSRDHVNAQMEVYESLPFIVAFGYASESSGKGLEGLLTKAMHGKQMSPREFFDGSDSDYAEALKRYPWLDVALAGVACAPTHLNKRGVRICLTDRGLSTRFVGESHMVDLGIVKYNFQAPLEVCGEWEWGVDGIFRIIE